MHATAGFKLRERRQNVMLSRFYRGLLISLMLHLGFASWLTGISHHSQPTTIPGAELLRITIKAVPPHPETRLSGREISNLSPLADRSESAAVNVLPEQGLSPATPEQTYIAPENVEEMAYVVSMEDLPMPIDEKTPSGTLHLKILISETGNADQIDIVTSSLPDSYAATLVNSFYKAKFNPARIAGFPIRSWRIIEIRFGDAEPASS